tara:strand:- start:1170 stop:1931 length:762 start_codon:yes stop_codon:yes gene_type:complete
MPVTYDTLGRVAVLTLNRPEARNAINQEMADSIEAAIDRFEEDDEAWIGILAGNGPAFCAGADLKAVTSGATGLSTERGGFGGIVQRKRSKPLIAAVEGPALAGGTEIVLSCDLVVAGTEARFGLPEVRSSLVANAGGLFRLPRALPRNIAMELILTAGTLPADRAYQLGLINRLVDAGGTLEAACALADEINANAPIAVRASRRIFLAAQFLADDEGFEVSARESRVVFQSEDFQEGPRAFIEKRPPKWAGR